MKYVCLGYYDEKKWEVMSKHPAVKEGTSRFARMIRKSERRRSKAKDK
jgi:hypothetical protein